MGPDAATGGREPGPHHPGPDHFGNPRAEYESIRQGAALIDHPRDGCLVLTGADRLDLLQRTTTGELKDLAPGRLAGTVIQTETARILDHVDVLVFPERILLRTGPGRAAADAAWVDRMTIMDDVQVHDASGESEIMTVAGPRAAGAIEAVLPGAGGIEPGGHVSDGSGSAALTAARTGSDTFLLVIPAARVLTIVERLVTEQGVTPAGREAAEAYRLEEGIPAVGRELTEAANPLEAGLRASIGFEKGCYPGQEVIARMITYKSIKRRLCGFRLAREVSAPAEGEALEVSKGSANAGRVTSTARSWREDGWIGLGYVRNDEVPEESGEVEVTVQTESGPVEARVVRIPFRS